LFQLHWVHAFQFGLVKLRLQQLVNLHELQELLERLVIQGSAQLCHKMAHILSFSLYTAASGATTFTQSPFRRHALVSFLTR
jgi:hypothetical protein